MPTSQLATIPGALRCKCCGQQFEVSGRAQCNPERLMAIKEAIAAKHTCRKRETVEQVRTFQMPSGKRGLEAYWNQHIARLMPV